jgi:predicted nucleic acid-binding protein
MRIALDTNFLLYAEAINDAHRRDIARDMAIRLSACEIFVPVQVLGELFRVLTRKARRDASEARDTVLNLRDMYTPLETTHDCLIAAMDLSVDHQINIWDAVILSCAAEAKCRLLLSEDMHEGFVWRGVTVANPFSAKLHPLLESALT